MTDAILILVQLDDCSGEVLGEAMRRLNGLGVRNVQLLSSITKKGRPGNVLLLDLDRGLELEVSLFLAAELGAWGYHVLEARHRHFDVTLEERQVVVRAGAERQAFSTRFKFFREGKRVLRVKLEHDDLEKIDEFGRANARPCSLRTIRGCLEQQVWSQPERSSIELFL
ncbi:MAG: nickel insertion protein [Thermoleophilia bacterium]